jgi:hypothetical protein
MLKSVRFKLIGFVLAVSLLVSLQSLSLPATFAQGDQGESFGPGPTVIFRAGYIEGGSKVKVLPQLNLLQTAAKTATINVNYLGSWDPNAKAAFEYAKDLWESYISSPVTIEVDATWQKMNDPRILGGAMATDYRANFSGAPVADTLYPNALANKLYGSDINPSESDITATFNSAFPSWYFGTDGNPGRSSYDFVSVVLHEIGHGLGFSGSMIFTQDSAGNDIAYWGMGSPYPTAYDRFVVDNSSQLLISAYSNHSTQLASVLESNALFFNGSNSVTANNGVKPKLFAPSSWQQGSSYSHLDENTYPEQSGNSLMTPALLNGEVAHSPGPITMGIFSDIGWSVASNPPPSSTPQPPNATMSNFIYFPLLSDKINGPAASLIAIH